MLGTPRLVGCSKMLAFQYFERRLVIGARPQRSFMDNIIHETIHDGEGRGRIRTQYRETCRW
jgi:hypothetical protein